MATATRARVRTPGAAFRKPVLAPEGIVTAIVAVTNHQDSVNDIIVPGAFTDTLKKRRPKVCWMHEWKDPIGRVLHVAEYRPGDKRLPKKLPDGRAWPREAGALIATMQFHMGTARGREMFTHAQEWSKNGECPFSIGYRVIDGMASKRADGVRLIYGLELFEISLVLHGAHNMALALEVKDALNAGGMETKDSTIPLALESKTPAAALVMEGKAAESMIGSGAMVALYPSAEVAEHLAVEGGSPAGELHVTLAFLGDRAAVEDPAGLAAQVQSAIAGTPPLSGEVGGIGIFPDKGDGTPVWVPVDVPGLAELRGSVVGALDAAGTPQVSEHGFTPHLTLGYDLPGLDPVDPTPVTFDTAYLVVGDDRYPIPFTTPNQPSPMEGKDARLLLAAATAASPIQEGTETKMMKRMKGSFEDLREQLEDAIRELVCRKPKKGAATVDSGVCIEATMPTHVIYSKWGDGDSKTYRIDYQMTPDGSVALGKPSEVSLDVVVVGDAGPAPTEAEVEQVRYVDPLTSLVESAMRRIEALPEGFEVKNHAEVPESVLRLIDALAVKGLDLSGALDAPADDEDDDESEYDYDPGEDDDYDEDEEWAEVKVGAGIIGGVSDGLTDGLTDDEGDEFEDDEYGNSVNPDDDTVTLDPAQVQAEMDELRS